MKSEMKNETLINREKLDEMMREQLTRHFSDELVNIAEPVITVDTLMKIWDLVIEYEAKNSQSSDKSEHYKNLVHKIKMIINGVTSD